MRRCLWLVLALALGSGSSARADTPFQSLPEEAALTFRYPSGKYRLLSEGNDIRAYDHAWSDTTNQGIEPDHYISGLAETGDSIGVYVWRDLAPGKYYFVERAGTDSVFAAPKYFRMGHDLAPPASIYREALTDTLIILEHLADSLLSSPRLFTSLSIPPTALKSGIDGSKIATQSLPATAIDDSVLTSSKFAAGFSFGDLDVDGHTSLGRAAGNDSTGVWGDLTTHRDVRLGDDVTDLIYADGAWYWPHSVRDSLDGDVAIDTFIVPGISELRDAGFYVSVDARWNWNQWQMMNEAGGVTYNRVIFASVIGTTGDSCLVTLPAAISDICPIILTAKGVD